MVNIRRNCVFSYFCFLAVFILLRTGAFSFIGGGGGLPGEFMYTGSSARAFAMGRAMTAYADDINAIYYNPAGLVLDGDFEVAIMNHTPLDGLGGENDLKSQYNFAGLKLPLGVFGTLGGGVIQQAVTNLYFWDEELNLINGDAPGAFSQMAVFAAWGKRFFLIPYRITAIGVSVTALNQTIAAPESYGFTANSWSPGVDLGLVQQISPNFFAGVTIKNLLQPKLKYYENAYETLPYIFKTGIAYSPNPDRRNKFWSLVFGDSFVTADLDMAVHSGVTVFTLHTGFEKRFVVNPGQLEVMARIGVSDIGIYGDFSFFEADFTYGMGVLIFDMFKIDAAADTNSIGPLNRIVLALAFTTDTRTGPSKDLLRLAREEQEKGEFLRAKGFYRALLETDPKETKYYANVKAMDDNLNMEKNQVRKLCRQGKYDEALIYLESKKKRPYYSDMRNIYISVAMADLRKRHYERDTKVLEQRLKIHLINFPNHPQFSAFARKMINENIERDRKVVDLLCQSKKYDDAFRHIEQRKEKAHYPDIKSIYLNHVKEDLRAYAVSRNMPRFMSLAQLVSARHYPDDTKLKDEINFLIKRYRLKK